MPDPLRLVLQSNASSFPSPMCSRVTILLFWYVFPLSENQKSPAPGNVLLQKVKNIYTHTCDLMAALFPSVIKTSIIPTKSEKGCTRTQLVKCYLTLHIYNDCFIRERSGIVTKSSFIPCILSNIHLCFVRQTNRYAWNQTIYMDTSYR